MKLTTTHIYINIKGLGRDSPGFVISFQTLRTGRGCPPLRDVIVILSHLLVVRERKGAMLSENERSIKFRGFRKCLETKLRPYGPGIDFGIKERFVDFGTNTILVIMKKGLVNVTRTARYEQIEVMEDTEWVKEMVEAFPAD